MADIVNSGDFLTEGNTIKVGDQFDLWIELKDACG
jgi:hypothetical protein